MQDGTTNDTATTGRVTRRDVLRGGAAAAATVAGGSLVTNTVAAASDYPHFDAPEHVSITTDPAAIRPWQPRLTWDVGVDDTEPLGYWCFRASSPEHDTDCIVGFHEYAQQDGATGQDSHAGDHEPIYVFFDAETGEVDEVVVSGYHWYAQRIPAGSLKLVESDGGGQQPVLRRVRPWNHHLPTDPDVSPDGRLFPVEDLDADLGAWLTNGMDESLRVDQPYDPWVMRQADDWWREDALNGIETTLKRVYVTLGIGDVPDRSRTGWSE